MFTFLSEKYIGKPANMVKCQDILQGIFNEKNPAEKLVSHGREVKEMERLLAEAVNAEEVVLHFRSGSVNAYTMPVIPTLGQLLKGKDTVKITMKNGQYQFVEKEGKLLYICIYTELCSLMDWNAEKTMGVLLHELGHNMYQITATFGTAYIILSPLLWWFRRVPVIKKKMKDALGISKLASKFTRKIKRKEIMDQAAAGSIIKYEYLYGDRADQNKLKSQSKSFIQKYAPGNIMDLLHHIGWFKATDGYVNEKFSDKFAAALGYGPALSAALKDLHDLQMQWLGGGDKTDEQTKTIRLLNQLAVISVAPGQLMDPHPEVLTRINEQLNELRKEAQKADPQTRKVIERDIKAIQSIRDEIVKSLKEKTHFGKEFGEVIDRMKDDIQDKDSDVSEVLDKNLEESHSFL